MSSDNYSRIASRLLAALLPLTASFSLYAQPSGPGDHFLDYIAACKKAKDMAPITRFWSSDRVASYQQGMNGLTDDRRNQYQMRELMKVKTFCAPVNNDAVANIWYVRDIVVVRVRTSLQTSDYVDVRGELSYEKDVGWRIESESKHLGTVVEVADALESVLPPGTGDITTRRTPDLSEMFKDYPAGKIAPKPAR